MGGAAEERHSTSLPGLLKGSVRWEIQCARDADNVTVKSTQASLGGPCVGPMASYLSNAGSVACDSLSVCFVPLVEPCLSMPASGRILFVWAEAGLIPDIL